MLATNTARRAFVALFLALFALAPLACGGDDPNELIDQTFKGGKKVSSGRVSVGVTIRAQGSPQLSQPVDVRLNGPFQSQGKGQLPKFAFDLNVNAAGRPVTAGAISTGNAGFVQVQGTAYQISDQIFAAFRQGYQQAQQRAQQEKGKSNTGLAGIDPKQWLRDAKVEDNEDVAGTDTQHVSSKLDVPKLLADVNSAVQKARAQGLPQAGQLPQSITPAQQKKVAEAIKGATFDFWTGADDKILRRLRIAVNFQVPEAERAQAQGVTGGQLAFSLEMAELNKPQQIAAPANAKPFNDLIQASRQLGLGGLLGGAGGASSGTGATGTAAPGSSGGTSSAAAQAYLNCVQQAGGDQAKAQRCAALIGR